MTVVAQKNKEPENIAEVLANAKKLYSEAEVEQAISSMAAEIENKLKDKNPIIMCALNGGLITTGKLLTKLSFPLQLDYIHATRYNNTTQGHNITWKATPNMELEGRTILIVDDILDGGITLADSILYCKAQGATEVYTAVLVDKLRKREVAGLEEADFVGLTIPDEYVFGFGMDYKGYLRNTPGIFAI